MSDERWLVAERLIDGTGSPPVAHPALALRGGRVAEIRAGGSRSVPTGAPLEEFAGCTILPGLINGHAHVCLDSSFELFRHLQEDSDLLLMTRMVGHVQAALQAGVTTIKDNGGRGESTIVLRDSLAAGRLAGPDLVVGGVSISNDWVGMDTRIARTGDEIRARLREQLDAGADFVHMYGSGSRMGRDTPRWRARYSVDEFRTAVETAGERGRRVYVDVHATEAARFAVQAGVAALEHIHWVGAGGVIDVPPDLLDAMAERGIYAVPTLAISYLREKAPAGAESSWVEDPVLGAFEARAAVVARMYRAGVPIIAGSDAGGWGTPFGEFAYELELLARCGIPALDVIGAATGVAGRFLGREADIGSVTPGKRANLLIVEGDPLDDMHRLWDVRAVFKDGRPVVVPGCSRGRR